MHKYLGVYVLLWAQLYARLRVRLRAVCVIHTFLPNVMLPLNVPASIHSTAGENEMLHNIKAMNSLQYCSVWFHI